MRSSSGASFRISSMLNLRGFFTSPSTDTVQFEMLRVLRRIALVRAEFVEIVVVRHILVGVLLFGGAERAGLETDEFRAGKCHLRWRSEFEQSLTGHGRRPDNAHGAQEIAPVQINRLWRDVGVSQIRGFADQHLLPPMPTAVLSIPILRAFICVRCGNLSAGPHIFVVLRSARPAASLVIGAGYRRKVTSKLKAQERATFQRCPWSLDSTF